jgi:hypothetical protein
MMMEYLKFFSEVSAHMILFALLAGAGLMLLAFAFSLIMWLIDKSREEKSQWRNWDI